MAMPKATTLPIACTHAAHCSTVSFGQAGWGLLSAHATTAPAQKVISATTAQSLSVLPCFMAFPRCWH